MTRVFIGIGSNSGDRQANLRLAVDALPDVVAVSPLYATQAVGTKHGADEHLNAVVELHTGVSPAQLLKIALDTEERAGRDRSVAGIPVPLDVDILLFGDEQIDVAGLRVPHPRMWDRRFVLAPLADIAPDLVVSSQLEASEGAVVRTTSL